MIIRRVAAEFFHADRRTNGPKDRQTDMTKLMVAFHSFAKEPHNFRDIVRIMKYREVGST